MNLVWPLPFHHLSPLQAPRNHRWPTLRIGAFQSAQYQEGRCVDKDGIEIPQNPEPHPRVKSEHLRDAPVNNAEKVVSRRRFSLSS